jgi:hypothetical protein
MWLNIYDFRINFKNDFGLLVIYLKLLFVFTALTFTISTTLLLIAALSFGVGGFFGLSRWLWYNGTRYQLHRFE